jgi:hypothetical protein
MSIAIILVSPLFACGLRYIDAPPVTQESRWIKNGFTKNDVYRALNTCGYDRSLRDETQRAAVDNCMLSLGFTFIDSPYGEQGSICMYPEYQQRPSCLSLDKFKNQR